MPVGLSRLKIVGFKSFADPVSVEILPGLTGIVGPNGCGKSNVVEALRWAMGESSARTLRGGEMDDVIFAGTANRASRNLAEVVVTLEEAAGRAPPPFHEQSDLQISRRIERGGGSAYRVNGREVRARDVQTLFADLASGARSSGMISQGRVGAIVNAKPEDRRAVLEEAAGITGLHARRHEAELRLRAAEANLARAEDLRTQLDTQLAGLKRQAKQAARYRTISTSIRDAEAEFLAIQRARVDAVRTAARTGLMNARAEVAGAVAAAAAASAGLASAAADLPPLREREAEARTALERHRLAREQIVAEEQRARAALAATEARLRQIARDLDHAQQLDRDAGQAAQRLAAEESRLREAEAAHPALAEAATAALLAAQDAMRAAEAEANRATERAASLSTQADGLNAARAQADQRARRLTEQVSRLERDRAAMDGQLVPADRLAEARARADEAETDATHARKTLDEAERIRATAGPASAAARARENTAEAARGKLAAEIAALAEVLAVKDGEKWPPMVDALGVPAGLEAALGAALGEELNAGANPDAARHWTDLDPIAAVWPDGVVAFDSVVTGPPATRRALSHIALIGDPAQAEQLRADLASGQTLVSRDGAVWRWDGYTVRAGAPTAAAVRLKQRNRLAALRGQLDAASAEANQARAARHAAETAEREAQTAEHQARARRKDAETRLEQARAAVTRLTAQAETAQTRMAGLDEQLAALSPERDASLAELARAQAALAELPDLAALRESVTVARSALTQAREVEAAARARHQALDRDAASRATRLQAIGSERPGWVGRAKDAAGRVVDLAARARDAAAEHQALLSAPADIAAQSRAAIDALESAEAAHRRAAQTLAAASDAAAAAERSARAAEQAVATAREDVVRAEGRVTQADHEWGTVAERILERMSANPALPDPPADFMSGESAERARRRLERLLKERDEMGPVNLRAEIEAGEIEAQMEVLARERDELTTAIAKLRGSIGHINREGRERLAEVFHSVDQHFQALFARMFGGGRAHLALVGSDDPLEAGLEIYAQPPGKKLATLSLLSGGEQALTALSLIFAVFRCNPAPICVLDEVDAPLDDANVERFCTLLDDIRRETGTRFLVVTHHHLTMARMDRLYGVTMQERGVSGVLSVDLRRATEMVDAPRAAAE